VELIDFTKVLVSLSFHLLHLACVFSYLLCTLDSGMAGKRIMGDEWPWKVEAATKSKVAGNDLFNIGKFYVFLFCSFEFRVFREADLFLFSQALNYISEDGIFEDEVEKSMKTLRVSCWLNHATCCLKLKDNAQAISLCSKVCGRWLSCHLQLVNQIALWDWAM
jgi:hypothetical protein